MSSKKYTSGFCSSCHKNVPHRRWIGHPIAFVLDLLTLRLTRFLRLGPWYCVHCDNRVGVLPLRKPDAMDYRSAALGNENESGRKRKQRSPQISSASDVAPPTVSPTTVTPEATPSKPELEPAESVGNFIKTDSSLLMKSNRMQRYSEKYRDAVVRRILSRASSIMQVREEKNLSESEITDWIADLFERQQEKIDVLELFKKSVSHVEHLDDKTFQDLGESGSIPGQVRPR